MTHASPTPPDTAPRAGRHSLGLRLLQGLLVLVAGLMLLLSAGAFYLYSLLQRQGIHDIQIQFHSVGLDHLALERLAFVRRSSETHQELKVQAQALRLDWDRRHTWLPRLEQLQVQNLQIFLDAPADRDKAFLAHQKLAPWDWASPGWLPRQISVDQIALRLPCADGQCQLNGSAQLVLQDQAVSGQVQLVRDEHRLEVSLQGAFDRSMTAEIRADGQAVAQLQGNWQPLESDRVRWQGQWALNSMACQPWLLEWLAVWQPQLTAVAGFPVPPELDVTGAWDLESPQFLDEAGLWPALTGAVKLQARLERPMAAPMVGEVAGNLDLGLEIRAGQLDRYRLQADASLARLPGAEYLARFPGLDPGAVRIQARSQGDWRGLEETRPVFEVSLESSGALSGEGQGEVAVSLQAPFTVDIKESRFQLRSRQLIFTPDIQLANASAYLEVQGSWEQDGYRLEFGPASWISADRFDLALLSLERARLEADRFTLAGQDGPPQLQGQLRLTTSRLMQEQLHPQPWQAQGELVYDKHTWRIQGRVRAQSGLAGQYDFHYQPGQPMKLEWQIQDLYFLAANPLPAVFKQWPQLLEVSRGKLSARGQLILPGGGDDSQIEVGMQLRDLGGIYDRTLVDGLSADLELHTQGKGFTLSGESSVERLNPGVSMGPLHLAGSYSGRGSDLRRGMVSLRRLELELLGGRVWTEPISFDLSDKPVEMALLIRGIDLAQVLELYASQDLSGHGTLDGILPLQVSSQGIAVAAGNLYARPPGGVLRYSHAQVRNVAKNDTRMEVLAEVLENFHYSLLSSDIAYGDDGQLTLGIQLRGRNPRMQDSPPVHLNINLEENLPMLLASLQMASNLSDTVKKRVNEALRQRQATKSP